MLIPFHIDTEREWENAQNRPYLVWSLLAAYAAVHIYLALYVGTAQWIDLVYRFGVVKTDLHWYSFITCTFLHGNWLHWLGNSFFLWIYGSVLERYLGSWRFALLYLGGAFASMAAHLWTLSPFFQDMPAIGASGAISTVLGAFFVLLPRSRLRCIFIFFLRPLVVTLPAWVVLGFWFILQLYFSLGDVTVSESVAFWAHVAGFAAGALAGPLLYWQKNGARCRAERLAQQALSRGWGSFLASGRSGSLDLAHAVEDRPPDANRTTEPLLRAVGGMPPGTAADEDRQNLLLRAFQNAESRLDYSRTVTIYLQLIKLAEAERIPPAVHRAAANAAIACHQPALGLQAFRDALRAGLEEGVEQVIERSRRVLAAKFGVVPSDSSQD
jgi:membrane associated rhomboid family serine protease